MEDIKHVTVFASRWNAACDTEHAIASLFKGLKEVFVIPSLFHMHSLYVVHRW